MEALMARDCEVRVITSHDSYPAARVGWAELAMMTLS